MKSNPPDTSPLMRLNAITLIIFTRYPTPGTVKTRLISAVGAAEAANLHRLMTENTLHQARALAARLPISIVIYFDGDNSQQMADWLGADLVYQSQGVGDLGMRMDRSISTAHRAGAERIVLIGTDCPELTAQILDRAFELLLDRDLVLGAAQDGGYYLIGMRQPQPVLFVDIDWSTERVCQQTIDTANRLNLSRGSVSTLADIDLPADIPRLMKLGLGAKISIVIPALNESGSIARVLERIHTLPNLEIILVDGGSIDDTMAIARNFDVKVLSSLPGRARQMNVGARAATGDILLFLHADTFLPLGFETMVRSTLQPPLSKESTVAIAGAFTLHIDDPRPILRSIERLVAWRSRWRQMPYGDQAIFLTAATFWELGGFTEMPIMEDYELICRLQRRGRIEIVAAPVLTSARRWLKRGVWKTTLINQAIVFGYLAGVAPTRLAAWYRRK